MNANELEYDALLPKLAPLQSKGRDESATFLNWFLENIYRLESTEADDCICDNGNDKGIDGIYVDHNNEEIHFFQSKIRQNANGTIGDNGLKLLSGSIDQFNSSDKIDQLLAGDANDQLKNLISRSELKNWVAKGYALVGIYTSNERSDEASNAYIAGNPRMRVFDRDVIASYFVEADQGAGITGEFKFDVSYVEPLSMTIANDEGNNVQVFIFPAAALQLVHLSGIEDTTLFQKNVRYELGNTPVNKSIQKSIFTKSEHKNFSLFHNGIIIICESAKKEGNDLTIVNYSVVNGAQSLTTFFRNKSKLSADLRVLVRVGVCILCKHAPARSIRPLERWRPERQL